MLLSLFIVYILHIILLYDKRYILFTFTSFILQYIIKEKLLYIQRDYYLEGETYYFCYIFLYFLFYKSLLLTRKDIYYYYYYIYIYYYRYYI